MVIVQEGIESLSLSPSLPSLPLITPLSLSFSLSRKTLIIVIGSWQLRMDREGAMHVQSNLPIYKKVGVC